MTREEKRLERRQWRWMLAGLLGWLALHLWLVVALQDALSAAMW